MKTKSMIFFTIFILCVLLVGSVYGEKSTEITGSSGAIDLGQGDISISQNTYMRYFAADDGTACAGYTTDTRSEAMGVTAGSGKPDANMALEFHVRSCQGPAGGCAEDNQVYQHPTGTVIDATGDLSDPSTQLTNATNWSVRGG